MLVGWWEENWRYWSVWVGFRYTLVVREPSSLHIILTSRNDAACPSLSSVNWMLWLMWASISSTWSAGIAERTSSTYLFQNTVGTGDILGARSSICSITMLATTTDTGEPIAVPKICWYTVPL